jgi:hypothetical protein
MITTRQTILATIALATLLTVGCSKRGSDSSAKRMDQGPKPASTVPTAEPTEQTAVFPPHSLLRDSDRDGLLVLSIGPATETLDQYRLVFTCLPGEVESSFHKNVWITVHATTVSPIPVAAAIDMADGVTPASVTHIRAELCPVDSDDNVGDPVSTWTFTYPELQEVSSATESKIAEERLIFTGVVKEIEALVGGRGATATVCDFDLCLPKTLSALFCKHL